MLTVSLSRFGLFLKIFFCWGSLVSLRASFCVRALMISAICAVSLVQLTAQSQRASQAPEASSSNAKVAHAVFLDQAPDLDGEVASDVVWGSVSPVDSLYRAHLTKVSQLLNGQRYALALRMTLFLSPSFVTTVIQRQSSSVIVVAIQI